MNWNLKIVNGPIRTQINNGSTHLQGGMPLKDSTTTNENRFSMSRHDYKHTNKIDTTRNAETIAKKKWISNGNRDASSIIHRKKTKEIGYSSLNPHGNEMSFTEANENTWNQARQRTRNQGYVIPPKVVTHRNAPIFY